MWRRYSWGYGPTHSSHQHTPQEVGQIDQSSTRWRSVRTLNVGADFFPSVLHVQVHMSEPVEVACVWVVGEGDRAGDRMCPDIRLVMYTGGGHACTTPSPLIRRPRSLHCRRSCHTWSHQPTALVSAVRPR